MSCRHSHRGALRVVAVAHAEAVHRLVERSVPVLHANASKTTVRVDSLAEIIAAVGK